MIYVSLWPIISIWLLGLYLDEHYTTFFLPCMIIAILIITISITIIMSNHYDQCNNRDSCVTVIIIIVVTTTIALTLFIETILV